MEKALLDFWLAESDNPIEISDEADVSIVRERIRELAPQVNLDKNSTEAIAIVGSELVQNQLNYAKYAKFVVRKIYRGDCQGLEIIAADLDGGLTDPAGYLIGTTESKSGLGGGLQSLQNLMDEFDFDIRHREGTCVRARKFSSPPPISVNVSIMGNPLNDLPPNGDFGGVFSRAGGLRLALADGVGHGEEANASSFFALNFVKKNSDKDLQHLLSDIHHERVGKRGTMLSLIDVDFSSGDIVYAGAGDVGAQLYSPDRHYHFGSIGFTLGMSTARVPAFKIERQNIRKQQTIVMYSDGLKQDIGLQDNKAILQRNPIIIAQHLIDKYGRGTDDAAVLVATIRKRY